MNQVIKQLNTKVLQQICFELVFIISVSFLIYKAISFALNAEAILMLSSLYIFTLITLLSELFRQAYFDPKTTHKQDA